MTLKVEGLAFTYPGWAPTLSGLSLEVAAGSSAFLLGPSGSGKSTLLRCIAGLEPVQAGRVLLDGRDVTGVAAHRRRIGFMAQEPALFPHLDVLRNVAFGLRYRADLQGSLLGRRGREQAEARHWLDVVGIAQLAGRQVDELSGGQRQRVALARTLAARPRAVLLDEPLSALDRDLREGLGLRVKELLAKEGVAALWVTHDRDEAGRLGDAVWEMRDGRAVLAARVT